MARTFRMFPPIVSSIFTTQRGAVIDATVAGYYDAAAPDAEALAHAGWTNVIEIGTTASRPMPGPSPDTPGLTIVLTHGCQYYDTSLSAVVFYNTMTHQWVSISNVAV